MYPHSIVEPHACSSHYCSVERDKFDRNASTVLHRQVSGSVAPEQKYIGWSSSLDLIDRRAMEREKTNPLSPWTG